MHTSLLEDFGIDDAIRTIAIVGAGGKTSLMYALASEITARSQSVVSTTTTKIFHPKPDESPVVILLSADPELRSLPALVAKHRHVTVAATTLPGGKLQGVSVSTIDFLLDRVDVIIVEADGAARLPVKAPERWEPVIPPCADLVIPVVGLDCIGRPASDEWVFRLESFLALTGLKRNEEISPEAIALLLLHPEGGLKGVPEKATVIPFLNKLDMLVDSGAIPAPARALESRSRGRVKRWVIGKLVGGAQTRAMVLS